MPSYFTLLTPAGLAKVTNAQLTNEKIEISQIAVGDANGTPYQPVGTETALRKEVWRGGIASIEIDSQNPNWIVVEGVIPASAGGFTIREVGLFDTDGAMIAIGNYPDTYKPVIADGSTMDLALRTIIEVNNASSVTLRVDPNVIVASRKYVDDRVSGAIAGIGPSLTALDERITTHISQRATLENLGHVRAETDENGNLILPKNALEIISEINITEEVSTLDIADLMLENYNFIKISCYLHQSTSANPTSFNIALNSYVASSLSYRFDYIGNTHPITTSDSIRIESVIPRNPSAAFVEVLINHSATNYSVGAVKVTRSREAGEIDYYDGGFTRFIAEKIRTINFTSGRGFSGRIVFEGAK